MNEELSAEEKIVLSIPNVNKEKYHVVKRHLVGKSSISKLVREVIYDLYERIINEETK